MGKKNMKKAKLPEHLEDMKDIVIRRAAIVVVALLVAATVFLLVKAFLYRSDYFRLRTVETRAAFLDRRAASALAGQLVNIYQGCNVFNIPLQSVARAIRGAYADVRDVAVRIAPPDKLVVELKLRRAVAFVHNTRFYPIDEEGVALPPVGAPESMKDIPIIDGIDLRNSRKGSGKNLKLALALLSLIRQSRFMDRYGVAAINAEDSRNMSFFLKNGLEVRIGSENFEARLEALERTLRDPRLLLDKILYIDVRFSDVVIGPK